MKQKAMYSKEKSVNSEKITKINTSLAIMIKGWGNGKEERKQ